jgi:hypothetical protein
VLLLGEDGIVILEPVLLEDGLVTVWNQPWTAASLIPWQAHTRWPGYLAGVSNERPLSALGAEIPRRGFPSTKSFGEDMFEEVALLGEVEELR